MALGATIYNFNVQLSDVDRGVYEALAIKMACHPSETEEYLVTRLLAYCMEYTEGIGFSKGLADPEDPAVFVRDLTGAMKVWIDIGAPDGARLHKAMKASPRVAVYTHREPRHIQQQLAGQRIHRRESLEMYAMDRDLLATMAARLDRRTSFDLTITDRQLYINIDGESITGPVTRFSPGDE